MRECRPLFLLELRSLYGLNKLRHTRDPKARRRLFALAGVFLLLAVMAAGYTAALVWGLCTLGLGSLVPLWLTVASSLLMLAFGLFKAGERLFTPAGYDLLASLPVSSRAIVLCRFLTLYVEDLLFTALIFLPGLAVFGLCQRPEPGIYPRALLSLLFIPAIPLVISAALGTLVTAIASRMKRKSLAQTLLMVLVVLILLLGSFALGPTAETLTPDQLSAMAQTLGRAMARLYPPARWLSDALLSGDTAALLLFMALSAAVMLLALGVGTLCFHPLVRSQLGHHARHDYRLTAQRSRGLLKTLFLREARRYFSSSIYVTNTIIGPLLGLLMSVALWVGGVDALRGALPIPVDIPALLPFLLAAVSGMMTTTSCSVSMEGKQVWIVQSLPIPLKTLLDSKILLNLALTAPCCLLSVIFMAAAVRPTVLQLLWLLLIPASILLFVAVLGITIDLKLHRFDWEKEEAVVKQSLPSMLGGFAALVLSLLLGALVILLPPQLADVVKALLCLLLWWFTALLYRHNNRQAFPA